MVVSGITRARSGLSGAAQLKPVLKRIATESSFFFFLPPFYDPRPGLREASGICSPAPCILLAWHSSAQRAIWPGEMSSGS